MNPLTALTEAWSGIQGLADQLGGWSLIVIGIIVVTLALMARRRPRPQRPTRWF